MKINGEIVFQSCPRCGSSKIAIKAYYPDRDDTFNGYRCECENGHAWDEWLDSKDKAVDAWNERPVSVYTSASTEDAL